MLDLSELIDKWKNSALTFREAETFINLLIVDKERLEEDVAKWKRVAEDAAVADTKKEACLIIEMAIEA